MEARGEVNRPEAGKAGQGAKAPRVRVLCVDDEPNVLEGLRLHLERRYDLTTAGGGPEALRLIEAGPPFAVVVSDMRMPEMNGAEFLSRARDLAPHSVRMLLTGQTDLDSAVRAVNDGQVFRFLTKPCPAPQLLAAIEAGIEQHRLVTAERELLEQTLLGSVKVLDEVLSLAHPEAFGRAVRIKQYAVELAEDCGLGRKWELETAAMLSQLGSITLDRDTLTRANHGQALTSEDSKALARVPEVSFALVSHIPRLERVSDILSRLAHPAGAANVSAESRRLAEILRIAIDFDWLEMRGASRHEALTGMRQGAKHELELLERFEHLRNRDVKSDVLRQVALAELREGMILAEDVRTAAGVLFAARGYVITSAFVERARNFKAAGVPGTIQCHVPPEVDAAAAEAAAAAAKSRAA